MSSTCGDRCSNNSDASHFFRGDYDESVVVFRLLVGGDDRTTTASHVGGDGRGDERTCEPSSPLNPLASADAMFAEVQVHELEGLDEANVRHHLSIEMLFGSLACTSKMWLRPETVSGPGLSIQVAMGPDGVTAWAVVVADSSTNAPTVTESTLRIWRKCRRGDDARSRFTAISRRSERWGT